MFNTERNTEPLVSFYLLDVWKTCQIRISLHQYVQSVETENQERHSTGTSLHHLSLPRHITLFLLPYRLAAIRVSIASRRFINWSNIGVRVRVILALKRASKLSSTGRAILEFSTGFEVGVGIGSRIDKNSWEEFSFRIFFAGRKRPASPRGLEHMFLSNYQSKKTNIETQINLLEREKRGHWNGPIIISIRRWVVQSQFSW
jgi:hypothetical protein